MRKHIIYCLVKVILIIHIYKPFNISAQTPLPEFKGIIIDVNQVKADLTDVGLGLSVNHYLEHSGIQRTTPFAVVAKTMKLKSLRWPEGELGESVLWSVPPYDKANPHSTALGGVWPYNAAGMFDQISGKSTPSLDFDQYVSLCNEINAEAFVIIPIDAVQEPDGVITYVSEAQILENAVQMVRYAKTKGYKIKYWEIGNENDLKISGCISDRKWTAQAYADFVVKISRLMKSEDPSILIGANGMTSMSWWQTLIQTAASDIDFLITHQYMTNTESLGSGGWYDNYKLAMQQNWDFAKNITNLNNAIDIYAIPSDRERIKIAVTETSSYKPGGSTPYYNSDNAMGKAIIFFEMAGKMLSFDRMLYVHFWTSHWWTSVANDLHNALGSNNEILACGRSIQLMNEAILKKMLTVYPQNITVDLEVNMYAFYDPATAKLNFVLLNRSSVNKDISLGIKGIYLNNKTSNQVLQFKGLNSDDANPTFNIISNVITDSNSCLSTNVPAFSITLYSFSAEPVSPVGLKIIPDEKTIHINSSYKLSTEFTPAETTNKEIGNWQSSNTGVVTVDNKGKITGVSAGSATITAKSEVGKFAGECTVSVLPITDCKATGSILMQQWDNLPYTSISTLTSNINYPYNPSKSIQLSSFEAPSNAADNYGLRIAGFICAPENGSYTFWIAGDDNSELWLSTDESPQNKIKIAYSAWARSQEWNKYTSQKSEGITLEQGKNYYVEALLKEATGSDNLAVGWSKPGESTITPSEVIPGIVLSPLVIKPTKMEDLYVKKITLFPNPIEGNNLCFNVSGLEQNDSFLIEIYNSMGILVFQKTIDSRYETINFSLSKLAFPKGIYFVKISCQNSDTIHKLVVK